MPLDPDGSMLEHPANTNAAIIPVKVFIMYSFAHRFVGAALKLHGTLGLRGSGVAIVQRKSESFEIAQPVSMQQWSAGTYGFNPLCKWERYPV